MHPLQIPVAHNSHTRQIPVADATLTPFLSRVFRAFNLPPNAPLHLAFQTTTGDRAAVSTDFALQLVIGADETAGHLVLSPPTDLPTVDQCMHTVLKAVVDTAARGEAAAVFLALSGAWEHATRDFGDTRLAHLADRDSPLPTPSSASPPRRSASPARRSPRPSRYETPDSPLRGLHATLTRALEPHVSPDTGATMADAACARLADAPADELATWDAACRAAAETRALACFCTHTGVSCASCHVKAIQGTRYRCHTACKDINLCERCRRKVGDAATECRSFTVYDHPWEATEDYAESNDELNFYSDSLKAPPPPLALGDVGPRVMHLHYVLYKVGYLNVANPRFRVGVFCRTTRDAISRFQMDHRVGMGAQPGPPADQDHGVYTALTRSVLLSLFDELELRCARSRCAAVSGPQSPRLRTAMAA